MSGVAVAGTSIRMSDAEASLPPPAPVSARDDEHALLARGRGGEDDVLGIAAGRERQQHAARLAMGLDLAGEDGVVAVIVAPGGEHRRIGGQRHGAQGAALLQIPPDQLAGDVLRIGRRAAIAADQQRLVLGQGAVHRGGRLLDARLVEAAHRRR